jgi:hypothetical protein
MAQVPGFLEIRKRRPRPTTWTVLPRLRRRDCGSEAFFDFLSDEALKTFALRIVVVFR